MWQKSLPGYIKIGGSQLTRMAQDRELNFEYSYRYFIDVIAQRNSKVDKLADVKVPVLILHGSRDRNVYPAVSEEFFKLLRTKKKEIKFFDCGHWFMMPYSTARLRNTLKTGLNSFPR